MYVIVRTEVGSCSNSDGMNRGINLRVAPRVGRRKKVTDDSTWE
jgi:hypothetical protein